MARGLAKTICPSEVARLLAQRLKPHGDAGWRSLMPAIRTASARLVADQRIVVMQRGQPVDPLAARGPIRLGLSRTVGDATKN